jgi:hypothetical protein
VIGVERERVGGLKERGRVGERERGREREGERALPDLSS